MADIEKAREHMRALKSLCEAQGVMPIWAVDTVSMCVNEALRALDGAEEWEARTDDLSKYQMQGWPIVRNGGYDIPLAVVVDRVVARRIARLPALERAARRLIDDMNKSRGLDIDLLFGRDALVAAINQEGQ